MTVTAGRARTAAFLVVAGAWFAMMAGSNVATPLYAIYEREFGFSSAVLTLVFATYALCPGAVAAAVRAALGPARAAAGDGRGVRHRHASASRCSRSPPACAWLFAARAVQGLAVGMISGAAAAALVELDPAPQEDRAALFAALAQAGGSASGPIIAGMLAEWAPKPLVLPFALFAALGVVATVAALAIPEPGRVVPGRLRVVRPSVPREIRVAVRARERHRRGGLGRRRAVALRRALLRRRPARHVEPGAAGRASARCTLATSCVAQIAARRSHAHARMQAVGPRPARARPARARARLPGPLAARPAARRAC